ncbi:hypothetical protein ACEPPN_005619 [Leptodophora sp. 'Broadleaf-Isolate-01']
MEQIELLTAMRKLTIGETGKGLKDSSSSTPAPSSSASPTLLLPLQDHKPPSNFTAILSTNKKINSEAKGYYFSHNTFAVGNHTGDTTDPPSTLTKFINTAAKEDLNVISSIEIVLFAALIDDNCCTLLRNSMRARFLAHFHGVMNVTVRHWSGDMVALREKSVAEALGLVLDGGEGFEGLEIERFKWSSKNVDWIEGRPVIVRGPGYVPVNIPGLVEGFRDGLKDEGDGYKPLLISEGKREAFYGTVGGV